MSVCVEHLEHQHHRCCGNRQAFTVTEFLNDQEPNQSNSDSKERRNDDSDRSRPSENLGYGSINEDIGSSEEGCTAIAIDIAEDLIEYLPIGPPPMGPAHSPGIVEVLGLIIPEKNRVQDNDSNEVNDQNNPKRNGLTEFYQ